jgi:hypothetical protein
MTNDRRPTTSTAVDFAYHSAHTMPEQTARRVLTAGPTDYFVSSRIRIEMLTTAAVFQSKTTVMCQ